MDNPESGRPAKKAKTEAPENESNGKAKSKQAPNWRAQQAQQRRQQRRDELNHPQPESTEHRRDRELFGIDENFEQEDSLKPLQDEEREKLRKRHFPKMFSQPSVIASGDKGIYVTCDKGKEKKSLIELADLVEDYLEKHDLIPAELLDPNALLQSRLDRQQNKAATVAVDNEDSPVEEEEIDIESSINAELTGMSSTTQGQGSHPAKGAPIKVKAFQLITLDVPCVSFLRFIPGEKVYENVDVVDLVHSICAEAAKNPGRMRSRHIRRLSPVVWMGKILSGGLEKACEETLPAHFKLGTDAEATGPKDEASKSTTSAKPTRFAIRITIRNNGKVSRDDTITQVATEVQKLGGDQHKVDLKGYEKGVLVEIYRGWVGMAVVDNTDTTTTSEGDGAEANKVGYGFGYEALKRFNLAEIYTEGFRKGEQAKEAAAE